MESANNLCFTNPKTGCMRKNTRQLVIFTFITQD